jgi:hypothetical protein
MGTSCCGKPIATIIKVADFEAGIVGLENALHNVYVTGLDNDEELMNDLLKWVKDSGNYISPSREADYRKALLREYRAYAADVDHKTRAARQS